MLAPARAAGEGRSTLLPPLSPRWGGLHYTYMCLLAALTTAACCIVNVPRGTYVIPRATLRASGVADEATGRQLLLQFANRRTPEADKEAALRELMQASDTRDTKLDAALAAIDDTSTSRPLLSVRRWPVPLPSRRAALGSFGRLLNSMEAEEPGSGARFQEGDAPRRRRFLLVLLRQLRTAKGVWALEKEARLRAARATTMEEMLQRTPAVRRSALKSPETQC